MKTPPSRSGNVLRGLLPRPNQKDSNPTKRNARIRMSAKRRITARLRRGTVLVRITAVGLTIGLVLLFPPQAFATDRSALARVTVYWPGEGSGANAAWNGARLSKAHCAVDPKKIPYGSKVVFRDAECLAVDTGPAVVNRKAARSSGRNAAERNAIVIDRFFDTKQQALAWAKANPPFMVVRVRTPDAEAAY